jgi:hypothetical protein
MHNKMAGTPNQPNKSKKIKKKCVKYLKSGKEPNIWYEHKKICGLHNLWRDYRRQLTGGTRQMVYGRWQIAKYFVIYLSIRIIGTLNDAKKKIALKIVSIIPTWNPINSHLQLE